MQEFLSDLANVSWWDLYQCQDVNVVVDLFYSKFVGILDLYAPVRAIQTRKKYAPWLSDSTKKLIADRNNAQKNACLSQHIEDWNKYKKLRNQLTNILKQEKSNWQRTKLSLCDGCPSQQWQHALGWLGWKGSGSPSQLFYDGKIINKPLEMADCMNNYFLKKIKTIQENLPVSLVDPLAKLKLLMKNKSCSFTLKPVHPDTVEHILNNLRNSKSAGLDMIDTAILKCSASYILPALTHIINLSIEKECFPTEWKTAKVIPLLKKGDPLNPQNYRPVAILPVISKILEKVVFCQIVQYMEENKLLHPNHHGFRSGHSTTTCLIQLYDRWVAALEEKSLTGVCMLDLSAAFDVVDHPLLLQKLEIYGFGRSSLNWLRSYLHDRLQTVYIEGKQSQLLTVSSGVPQGSILGPLLYIIFTNELPELIHEHLALDNQDPFNMDCASCGSLCCYADDSTFSCASPSLNNLSTNLSEKYNHVANFMGSNKLKLNGAKTHIMLLSSDSNWRTKLREDNLTLITSTGDPPIKTSKSERLLGCVLSQNLKWTEFILLDGNSLIKQLGVRINALKLLSDSASFKTRKMFANGLFLSKLIYLIPLWGGCESFLIRSLQIVQNRAARIVTKRGIFTSTKTLLKECGWLSVSQLIFFHSVVLLFRTRLYRKPRFLFDMAVPVESGNYVTRSSNSGNLKAVGQRVPSSQIYWNSFRWRSVRFWNQLPLELKNVDNIRRFKNDLKTWIQDNVEID